MKQKSKKRPVTGLNCYKVTKGTTTDIVIKPADKGSVVVIQDKQQYLLEAHCQLNNTKHYVKLSHFLQGENNPN